MEWQPIDTAPENTWILVRTYPSYDGPPVDVDRFRWRESKETVVVDQRVVKGVTHTATREVTKRERDWERWCSDGEVWAPLPPLSTGSGK